MRAPVPPPAADLRPLLEHERVLPPVPPAVRARVLARMRAAQAAGLKAAPVASGPSWPSRARWAVAAALLCLVSTAATAAVIEFRARLIKAPEQRVEPVAAVVAPPVAVRRVATLAQAPALPVAEPQPRRVAPSDAVRDELRLLKQARAAVSHQDYAAALRFVSEHTRRFKGGRLAEEREALRVSSLAGLGRTDEARRAAAAFQVRFPRSVLLEAVSQMPTSKL